jgi:hypothetical protein
VQRFFTHIQAPDPRTFGKWWKWWQDVIEQRFKDFSSLDVLYWRRSVIHRAFRRRRRAHWAWYDMKRRTWHDIND